MPVMFSKVFISAESFESAGVWDVDGDGVLDIVSGGIWYKGPDFRKRYKICNVPRYDEYHDDFSTIAMDIDGDGRLDHVTGGWWGNALRWRQCPADPTKEWPEHIFAADVGNIETTRAWDIDGDGEVEIVPNTPGSPLCAYKLIRDSRGKGIGKFSKHVLYPEGVGHGLGFGDIDGDGQGELITPRGILKAAGHPLEKTWRLVESIDWGFWDLSVPVLVVDVNGDGVNDLIIGRAHNFGLYWYEQMRGADGKRQWIRHPIDLENSQYHDLQWADIDGDGNQELITGQRYRAHCGNDPGEFGPLGAYYFKWNGESFTKQVIDYVTPGGSGGGVGITFCLADLRKTGRLDLVAPGKDGLYVYYNQGT